LITRAFLREKREEKTHGVPARNGNVNQKHEMEISLRQVAITTVGTGGNQPGGWPRFRGINLAMLLTPSS